MERDSEDGCQVCSSGGSLSALIRMGVWVKGGDFDRKQDDPLLCRTIEPIPDAADKASRRGSVIPLGTHQHHPHRREKTVSCRQADVRYFASIRM